MIRIAFILLCNYPGLEPVSVRDTALANGMKVLVVEDTTAGVAAVQVWYAVGSVNENDNQGGMAHMTEHLMFNGSVGPGNMFSDRISETGGYDNAWTDLDVTVYHSVVPPEAVGIVMSMEADRMVNLTFGNFRAERDVVMEERRLTAENDLFGKAYESLWSLSYLVHPYRNPTLGWDFSINSFTIEGVREFYETYYRPSRAILVVVGNVSADSVFSWAGEYFGSLSNPKGEPPEIIQAEPEQSGERVWLIPGETETGLYLASYHVPEASDPDIPGLEILSAALGQGEGSRLYRSLVKEQELAISVWAFVNRNRYPGLLVLEVEPQEGVGPMEISLAIDSEISRIASEGMTEPELERAKKQCLAGLIYGREYAEDLAFSVGEAAVIFGDPEYINRYPEMIRGITGEDLSRLAGKYLRPETRSVVAVVPGE